MHHETQCQRILKLLEAAHGWVPLPAILSLGIASHTRRLFELRKTHTIEMRNEWIDGQRRTAYRLVQ